MVAQYAVLYMVYEINEQNDIPEEENLMINLGKYFLFLHTKICCGTY